MPHILIIDDDPSVREVLRHGLERSGHQVTEARDGKTGLKAHRVAPVDLVITDLIMPGMEGLETIMEFKRLYPGLKIIAISGGGTGKAGDYLEMASKFGAHRTVAKPFSVEKLSTIAVEVLEGT